MPSSARRAPARSDEPSLYTPEAAAFLGLKPDTLYRWRLQSQRTGVQVGPKWCTDQRGRPFYLRSALVAFRSTKAS